MTRRSLDDTTSHRSRMEPNAEATRRRDFLARIGGAGAALALTSCATPMVAQTPSTARGEWDVSWIDRVRRARHRAVFDGPQGDVALMLAARYLENIQTAYGIGAPDVIAVLNLRTRAVHLGLSHAMWEKYPIGEDANVKDPVTGTPARRNVSLAPEPGASEAYAAMSLERLRDRGAVILLCDFALGHLASRLAAKVGTASGVVHAELRGGMVPGAILVPSGIFGLGEAQNAGCAFVPG